MRLAVLQEVFLGKIEFTYEDFKVDGGRLVKISDFFGLLERNSSLQVKQVGQSIVIATPNGNKCIILREIGRLLAEDATLFEVIGYAEQ